MLSRPPRLASRRTEPELIAAVAAAGPALVALSGGVDSSLVAALAHAALGRRARAVTLTGPAVSRAEVERAETVARAIGIEHALVPADPLARAEYRANPSNRCYFCRSVETAALRQFGARASVTQYLDGVHLDDLGDDRPGIQAMDEAGFLHPLVWAGWRKADVRAAARDRGLPNWDQPSDACLASRVVHGQAISEPLLRRIEAAEDLLRADGFRRVRVRVRGTAARIEVDPEEVARLQEPERTERTTRRLLGLGFSAVAIEPGGYGGGRGEAV